MADDRSDDPWLNCYFSLEINGNEIAQFRECSGFKSSSEPFIIQEGGLNGRTHVRPGVSKWNTVTLKRGITAGTEFEEWRDQILTDQFDKRPTDSGAVVVRSEDMTELRRFSFTGAWAVSWEGPTLNSGGSDLAVETLEIAYDALGTATAPPQEDPPPPPPPPPYEVVVPPVQFALDSSKLTPAGQAALAQVTQAIQASDIKEMWVEGHTCDLTSSLYSYNITLSQNRADACRKELEKQNPGTTFHSFGYGWRYPVQPNDVEAHRSANRRTQFFTEARSGKRPGELDYVRYNS